MSRIFARIGGQRVSSRSGLCLLMAIALLLAPLSSVAGKRKPVKFMPRVSLGDQTIEFVRPCFRISLSAEVSAANFFDGLQKEESSSGPQFQKSNKNVEFFPERLTITAHASVQNCFNNPRDLSLPPGAIALAEGLRLEGEWVRGQISRPAEKLSSSLGTIPALLPLDPESQASWTHSVEISAMNIPLTDQLLLSVYSKDGKKLMEFSFRL